MSKRVLVLTSWYFPYQILRWQDAVNLIYLEKADVVAEYDEELRSPSVVWKAPAVIRLKKNLGKRKKGIKFSRFNVFVRDKFCCQYCSKKFKMRELTYDHVVPRASGGRTEWTNIVTACKPCNSVKGKKTCDNAGMFPRNDPVRPKSLPLASPIACVEHVPEEWVPFLPVPA